LWQRFSSPIPRSWQASRHATPWVNPFSARAMVGEEVGEFVKEGAFDFTRGAFFERGVEGDGFRTPRCKSRAGFHPTAPHHADGKHFASLVCQFLGTKRFERGVAAGQSGVCHFPRTICDRFAVKI